jgi:CheY-like chemotaxis protein
MPPDPSLSLRCPMPLRKIIVVEDDPDIRYLLSRRLEEAGYLPIPAEHGVAALQMMSAHPDCRTLITDFMMPELGGDLWIHTLERLCSEGWSVVVVSAQEAIDPGPFLISPKPIDIPNLLSYLQRVA